MCTVYCSLLPAGRALCPASAQLLSSVSLAKEKHFTCVLLDDKVINVQLLCFSCGPWFRLCWRQCVQFVLTKARIYRAPDESLMSREEELRRHWHGRSSPCHPMLHLWPLSGQPGRGLKAEEGCPEPPKSLAHPVLSSSLGNLQGFWGSNMLLQPLLSCTQVPGSCLYSKAAFLCSDSFFRSLSLEADVISVLIDTDRRSLLRIRSRGDAGSSGAGLSGY